MTMGKFGEAFKKREIFCRGENLQRRDYEVYAWKKGEFAWAVVQSAAVVCLFAIFFYRSFWAVPPLGIVGILFFRQIGKRKKDKCKESLNLQFKECILSVAASLKAGYAVENAFLESRKDMCLLYGEDSEIARELDILRRGLVINITLEELLADLAQRSGSGEIRQFAQVFAIAKRSGGSLPEIIRSSVELIGQRIDTRQEIQVLLSGRRMEQTIMQGMPFGILAYVGMSCPGYFDSLYHNLKGIAVMTGCMALYVSAYGLGEHILKKIEEDMA